MPERAVVVHLDTEQVREWCNRCMTKSCLLVAVKLRGSGSLIGLFVLCEACDS